jgi:hypothetical protein
MSQGRGILTDQLESVLQVIQLGHKTGYLTVERGEGQYQESGEITFVDGQVMHAFSGQLQGNAALTWLRTWTTCRFLFVNAKKEKITDAMSKISSPSSSIRPSITTSPLPPAASPHAYPSTGDDWQRTTDVNFPLSSTIAAAGANITSRYPQRTVAADEGLRRISNAQLTRLHRQLYLLIDGKRNYLELVRLIGKLPEDVQLLLGDLERIGVIYYA